MPQAEAPSSNRRSNWSHRLYAFDSGRKKEKGGKLSSPAGSPVTSPRGGSKDIGEDISNIMSPRSREAAFESTFDGALGSDRGGADLQVDSLDSTRTMERTFDAGDALNSARTIQGDDEKDENGNPLALNVSVPGEDDESANTARSDIGTIFQNIVAALSPQNSSRVDANTVAPVEAPTSPWQNIIAALSPQNSFRTADAAEASARQESTTSTAEPTDSARQESTTAPADPSPFQNIVAALSPKNSSRPEATTLAESSGIAPASPLASPTASARLRSISKSQPGGSKPTSPRVLASPRQSGRGPGSARSPTSPRPGSPRPGSPRPGDEVSQHV